MTQPNLVVRLLHGLEDRLLAFAFLAMAFFPLLEISSRLLGFVGLPGSPQYVQQV